MLAVGDVAPDIALANLGGEVRRLSTMLPVCLYFYKVECPTSSLAMPVVARLPQLLAGARVVGVAEDDAVDVGAFVAELGVSFEQLVEEPPFAASQAFGITFTPTSFLIGADRRVAAVAEAWSRDAYNLLARRHAEMLGVAAVEVSVEGDGLPAWRPG